MSWSTSDERHFINGLSYHRGKAIFPTDKERLDLLIGYRDGILLRSNWGDMDREQVLAHVNEKIANYPKHIPAYQPKQGDKK